ncbi:MAG: hypothetical protein LC792_26070 [Actinobacteria bacterium]|nr:hypothetical protein [Actinomycetota bacterium]
MSIASRINRRSIGAGAGLLALLLGGGTIAEAHVAPGRTTISGGAPGAAPTATTGPNGQADSAKRTSKHQPFCVDGEETRCPTPSTPNEGRRPRSSLAVQESSNRTSITVSVQCPGQNQAVVGGGATPDDASAGGVLWLNFSGPASNQDGWTVGLTNTGTDPILGTAWAICVPASGEAASGSGSTGGSAR